MHDASPSSVIGLSHVRREIVPVDGYLRVPRVDVLHPVGVGLAQRHPETPISIGQRVIHLIKPHLVKLKRDRVIGM